MVRSIIGAFSLLPVAVLAMSTPAEDIAHCAAIAASSDRLACYDALAVRLSAGAGPNSSSPAVAATTPAPVAATAPGEANLPPAQTEKTFGLTPKQRHVKETGPSSIQAHVASTIPDEGNAIVMLDSGQAWKIADDDGRLRVGELVTIKRAALGSFMLWTESNRSYRAKRLR